MTPIKLLRKNSEIYISLEDILKYLQQQQSEISEIIHDLQKFHKEYRHNTMIEGYLNASNRS